MYFSFLRIFCRVSARHFFFPAPVKIPSASKHLPICCKLAPSTPKLIPVIRSLLLYITDSIKQFYLTRYDSTYLAKSLTMSCCASYKCTFCFISYFTFSIKQTLSVCFVNGKLSKALILVTAYPFSCINSRLSISVLGLHEM